MIAFCHTIFDDHISCCVSLSLCFEHFYTCTHSAFCLHADVADGCTRRTDYNQNIKKTYLCARAHARFKSYMTNMLFCLVTFYCRRRCWIFHILRVFTAVSDRYIMGLFLCVLFAGMSFCWMCYVFVINFQHFFSLVARFKIQCPKSLELRTKCFWYDTLNN